MNKNFPYMEKADQRVPGLERGLSVLELLSEKPYEMGFREIKEKLGIPPSSLWRILKVLVERGYVLMDPKRRTYRLGFKLASMGNFLLENSQLKSLVFEDLRRLSDITMETVELDIRVKDQLVLVEQVIGPEGLFMYSHPGSAMPYFHATAPGKVYLSELPLEKLKAVMEKMGFPKLTPYTIDSFEKLALELEKVKLNGYAVDIDEMREGVGRVAAAVYDKEGKIMACIAVVCPSFRLKDPERLDRYGRAVKEVAQFISFKHERVV